jgi:hypothetical protein
VSDVVGPGTLKFLIAWPLSLRLRDALKAELLARVGEADVRRLSDGAYVVHTPAEPSQIRDWLAPLLGEDESAFVVEFERWSGHGPAIDQRWLLRRGH